MYCVFHEAVGNYMVIGNCIVLEGTAAYGCLLLAPAKGWRAILALHKVDEIFVNCCHCWQCRVAMDRKL